MSTSSTSTADAEYQAFCEKAQKEVKELLALRPGRKVETDEEKWTYAASRCLALVEYNRNIMSLQELAKVVERNIVEIPHKYKDICTKGQFYQALAYLYTIGYSIDKIRSLIFQYIPFATYEEYRTYVRHVGYVLPRSGYWNDDLFFFKNGRKFFNKANIDEIAFIYREALYDDLLWICEKTGVKNPTDQCIDAVPLPDALTTSLTIGATSRLAAFV